ncbi:coiled-coil domain-containing protein 42 homolog isoform X1 [Lepisosteus oculatus]|uniref:coiled-coil domain-containing protein 42 homolog isoform X1 n=2 Tax=Lepisosteus oculatus TaxID=7918 RepID=UPI0035F51136
MTLNLEDYFRTVYEDKLLVKMPPREDDQLTTATRLLQQRREVAEVEQTLATRKEDFQMRLERLQQRREELGQKEEMLKEALLKFDKFLKENDSKQSRAVRKARAERNMARQKDREIKQLSQEIAALQAWRERLEGKVKENAIYWAYLVSATDKSEKFQEIRELIGRFDTMLSTREQLLQRESEGQGRLEEEKQRLRRFVKERSDLILQHNNQLAALQTQLDQARALALKWESKWNHIQATAAKKTLLLGQIKVVILNLFQMVNKHTQQDSDVSIEDPEGQLDRIQLFTQDLSDILSELNLPA